MIHVHEPSRNLKGHGRSNYSAGISSARPAIDVMTQASIACRDEGELNAADLAMSAAAGAQSGKAMDKPMKGGMGCTTSQP